MKTYHFGVPKKVIWILHIVFGIYFLILGYFLLDLYRINAIFLIIIGSMQFLYHSHIWINHIQNKHIH